MRPHANRFIQPVVCILMVAFVTLVLAPPARASDPATPAAGPIVTIGTAAVAKLAATKAAAAPVLKQEPSGADDTPFFKTKKGAAALIIMGGGVAYMFYSKIHDRVKSPIRE